MKNRFLKLFTLFGLIQMITINSLANILPINGMTTGALSDQLKNLFTPQGATFSIWGLIYLLLCLFTITIITKPIDAKIKKLAQLFIVNSLLNSGWIFAWHYQYLFVSLIIMTSLLINLVQINILIKDEVSNKLVYQLPFTIYFGWITIAMIANVTAFLVYYQWSGFGISHETWTLIILTIGILISLSQVIYFKKISYVLVIIWAFYGIYVKQVSASGFNNQYPNIVLLVLIGIIILSASLFWVVYFRYLKRKRFSIIESK